MVNAITTGISRVGSRANVVARTFGNRIARGTEIAVDFVLEMAGIIVECDEERGLHDIAPQMKVITSCGIHIGSVKEVFGNSIELACNSDLDSPLHFIPLDWVSHVDAEVYLDRDFMEVSRNTYDL